MKQKPGKGGGGGVEAHDFTVSEGHGHPLVQYKKSNAPLRSLGCVVCCDCL